MMPSIAICADASEAHENTEISATAQFTATQ
jgi:hypothetical protein